jgi:type VI secretion system secreted protein Hcp
MSYDIFVKISGIDGESNVKGHAKEIEALSLSWGMSRDIGVGKGGSGTGKASFQDVHFTKFYDSTSPNLYLALAAGTEFANVVITLVKSGGAGGGQKFGTFTLVDAFLTSVEATADGSEIPVEDVALTFVKIQWAAFAESAAGKTGTTVATGWDLQHNKKA